MPESNYFVSLLRGMISLAAVFGLLFGLRQWLLRSRDLSPQVAHEPLLKLRERVNLGPKSQALLVQAGEQSFLVVTTDQGVTLRELNELPPAVVREEVASPQFASSLREAMSLWRRGGSK